MSSGNVIITKPAYNYSQFINIGILAEKSYLCTLFYKIKEVLNYVNR